MIWKYLAIAACVIAILVTLTSIVNRMRDVRHEYANKVFKGQLVPDNNGVITLSTADRRVSCDGYIYLTVDSNGITYVLFPDFRGKGANTSGEVLSSRPPLSAPKELSFYVIGVPTMKIQSGRVVFSFVRQIAPDRFEFAYDLD